MKIVAVLAILLLFSACSGEPPKTDSLKVGVVASLTGVGSYQGQQELRGLELALEEINAKGGINGKQLELVVEDSKTEPSVAVTVTTKLAAVDGVKYIIGDSWTSTTAVMVPVTNEQGVILISPLATLDSLTKDDFFFRVIPNTHAFMTPLAQYAYNEKGVRKVAILRSATPFGAEHADTFRAEFERLGGEIVAEESFDVKSTDVRSELTKAQAQHPEAILNLHATGPMQGLLMRQAKELEINILWLGSWGSENVPLVTQYNTTVNGLTYPYPYDVRSEEQGVQTFVATYRQRYGEPPDLTAANSYDALKLLALVLAHGEDPSQVKTALLEVQNYGGGSGTISFDQYGDVYKPIFIKEIRDGAFVTLK